LRRKSVVSIGVDFENSRLSDTPRQLMRYSGSKKQLIVGCAVGHDGLYIAHMFPDAEGVTAILHIDYKPDAPHPRSIEPPQSASEIMRVHQCFGCHQVDHQGFANNAPNLSRDTLADLILQRIDAPEYEQQVKAIDSLTTEPFVQYRTARAEVRAAEGTEKARLWIKYRILEPKFDRTAVAMPNVGLSEREAEIVSTWLVEPSARDLVNLRVRAALGDNRKKSMLIFCLGGLAGLIVTAVGAKLWYSRRRSSV
jgi:hypothetical protein